MGHQGIRPTTPEDWKPNENVNIRDGLSRIPDGDPRNPWYCWAFPQAVFTFFKSLDWWIGWNILSRNHMDLACFSHDIWGFPVSMDWLMGKSTGNHWFSHEIWGFPVIFPLNQSLETRKLGHWNIRHFAHCRSCLASKPRPFHWIQDWDERPDDRRCN